MKTDIKILHLEDEPEVSTMVERIMDANGMQISLDRVQTGHDFETKLGKNEYDLILADFSLPDYDGFSALKFVTNQTSKIPFILFSGSIGEEKAIESLKLGATDYVLKQNINALFPAIKRALKEAEEYHKRKQFEEKLRQNEYEYRTLFEAAPDGIQILDANGIILDCNKAELQILGFERNELIGKNTANFFLKKRRNIIEKEFSILGDKNFAESQFEMVHKDGTILIIWRKAHAIYSDKGKLKKIILYDRDITQRKILESQLSEAQKLEAIGQLAAGIAHEINTPTQFVSDNIHFLKDALNDMSDLIAKYQNVPSKLDKYSELISTIEEINNFEKKIDIEYLLQDIPQAIEQSLEGVKRISKIVKAMKEFSHPGIEEKTYVDINKAIENTVTISKNEWKYVAEVSTEFEEETLLVPCLPGELNQVFLNIIVNAAHAIGDKIGKDAKEKGKIHITTRKNNEFGEIRISDTGNGIPENIKNKVFDPFFTTKEVGKGTGQGLAISHNVITKKHKGSIKLESELGKGTTFIIRLPLDLDNTDTETT